MNVPGHVVAPELQRYAELDQRLLAAVRGIRILPTVAWPASLENRMIAAYSRREFALPSVEYGQSDLADVRAELAAIETAAGGSDPDDIDPLGDYLRRTAESWRVAAEMLEAVGTTGVTAPSIALYGKPDDLIPGSQRSNLDAARYFVELSDELGADLLADDSSVNMPADVLRAELAAALDAFFGAGTIRVEVDPELTAKAAAGATRIRLRGGASFSEYDRHQLLAHEAFVHSLTALNGRRQPLLASLAHTSPRAGRYGKLVLGILAYLVYSNLLALAQAWVAKGYVSPLVGLWWVHGLALVAALWLIGRRFGWHMRRAPA